MWRNSKPSQNTKNGITKTSLPYPTILFIISGLYRNFCGNKKALLVQIIMAIFVVKL